MFKKLIILSIAFLFAISSVNAATMHIGVQAWGTSHLFIVKMFDSATGRVYINDVSDCKFYQEYKSNFYVSPSPSSKLLITVNSRAYRDYDWFRYDWESTGTTKSIKLNNTVNIDIVFDTYGDTLFNGRNLKLYAQPTKINK